MASGGKSGATAAEIFCLIRSVSASSSARCSGVSLGTIGDGSFSKCEAGITRPRPSLKIIDIVMMFCKAGFLLNPAFSPFFPRPGAEGAARPCVRRTLNP
jgi:hypothetical protein